MIEYPWAPGERPTAELRRGTRGFIARHLPGVFVALLVALLLGFALAPFMVITVPAGQVGVLWKRLTGPGIYCWCILSRGTILNPEELREEGLHLIWPWDKLYLYDLRLQATTEKFTAITKDGVNVTAEINFRFQMQHDSVAVFHKFIGPEYVKSLLTPEIGAQTRFIVSRYEAQQVYIQRDEIQRQIRTEAQKQLGAHLNRLFQANASEQQDRKLFQYHLENSVQLLDTLVLTIELPSAIVSAINRQTEQYYQIQEYRYRVEREAEESKRKQIEANGIAAFQQTVSQGISDSYLRWRGIEATLALAQSNNSKIVIIGNSKDGLPIILGNVDGPSTANTTTNNTSTNNTNTNNTNTNQTEKPTDGTTPPAGGNTTNPPNQNNQTNPPNQNNQTNPANPTNQTNPTNPANQNKQTNPTTPNNNNTENRSNSSLDLTNVEGIISRLTEALRTTGSGKNSETRDNAK